MMGARHGSAFAVLKIFLFIFLAHFQLMFQMARANDLPLLGAVVDVGLPGGVGAGVMVRPFWFLRGEVGLNTIDGSPGLHAGVGLTGPEFFSVSPSLNLEYGHQFEGDASALGSLFFSYADNYKETLSHLAYDYYSGHLGIEIGNARRFVVFLHGGISKIDFPLEFIQRDLRIAYEDPNITLGSASAQYVGPSGKAGLLIYFW